MARQLNIAGKNSDEIYTLVYPNNIINFCRYDFSIFLDHCTDLCRLAARSGEYNIDEVYSIRNSISGCHKYYEQNMRTIFEKIVVDCWIEYLCKQSDISVNSLWQSFMKCRTPFETAIFTRLSDYRYNRAINEWTNLIKMQEYAKTKVDFVFGVQIKSSTQALARLNYFDLLFNVASNEQGFPIDEIGAAGVYSSGRLPNSPFVMGTAAKEILRNQLKGMDYRDTPYKSRKNPELTDKIAMDAFAAIKEFIPERNDSMAKTIIKSMTTAPNNIYMPCSFKAIIDLELDATAQGTAYIQKCARCGDLYIRDEKYDYDYCSRPQKEGPTCLELLGGSEAEGVVLTKDYYDDPEAEEEEETGDDDDLKIIYIDKEVVDEKMDALYKEMAARVNVDMTQRDFSRWFQQELRLKERILLGEAGERELNKFIELSRGDEFATKKAEAAPEQRRPISADTAEEMTENGKPIKKFVFEKVERTQQTEKRPEPTLAESEKAALEAVRRLFGVDTLYPSQPAQPAQQPAQQPAPQFAPQTAQQYPSPAFVPISPAKADENANIVPVLQPQVQQPVQPSASAPEETVKKADLSAIELLKEKAKASQAAAQTAAKPPVQPQPAVQQPQPAVQQPQPPVQQPQPAVQQPQPAVQQPQPPVQQPQPPVQQPQPAQPIVQPQPVMQPAMNMNMNMIPNAQQNYAPYPTMQTVYPQAQQVYPYASGQYPQFYQQPAPSPVQPFRSQPSKVIRGAVAQQPEPVTVAPKPKTVVIPTDNNHTRQTVRQNEYDEQEKIDPAIEKYRKDKWLAATQTFPRLSPAADRTSVKMAESVFRPEPDVKLFTPKKPKPAVPSPYEKLKQPLKEYDRQSSERSDSEETETAPEREAAAIPVSAPVTQPSAPESPARSYGAISAYRSISESTDPEREESFSGVLEGIEREDGFDKDDGPVDSDGMPLSHKTKHVMKAVFGPTQASPFLNINRGQNGGGKK